MMPGSQKQLLLFGNRKCSLIKKICITFITISFISACSTGTRLDHKIFFKDKKPVKICKSYQSLSNDEADKKINDDIYILQQNVERNLVFREKAVEVLKEIDLYTQQDKPFSPDKIDTINSVVQREINLLQPVVNTLAKHSCWADYKRYAVSDQVKLKGLMIILATTMSLYDDYGSIIAVMNENDRLRRFLNQADSGYDRDEYLLEGLTEMFVDEDRLSHVTDLIKRYHLNEAAIKQRAKSDVNLHYLVQVVETSKAYPVMLKMDYFDAANHRRSVRRRVTQDTLKELGRSSVNALSGGFSNAIGDYEERKGLLYADKELEKSISEQLEIGDILLEKTPFRLTDSMIPGHWGHAAIWIGTEQELKNLGLWNHSLIIPYHEQIKRGELVAESLRTGTTLSPLSHFMNIDDLGVIRSRQALTDEDMRKIIILALRQIGKEYDFNFDVETTDKIVCSQLVYLSYNKINWPTESVVGRYTISPDNIAIKTLNNGPFELVLFYHDGKLVKENGLELMEGLMKQD